VDHRVRAELFPDSRHDESRPRSSAHPTKSRKHEIEFHRSGSGKSKTIRSQRRQFQFGRAPPRPRSEPVLPKPIPDHNASELWAGCPERVVQSKRRLAPVDFNDHIPPLPIKLGPGVLLADSDTVSGSSVFPASDLHGNESHGCPDASDRDDDLTKSAPSPFESSLLARDQRLVEPVPSTSSGSAAVQTVAFSSEESSLWRL
jgi:hypothetical protein